MLTLQQLSPDDGQGIYAMLQEIARDDNGFHNDVYGMTYGEFENWLKQTYEFDSGVNMPDWMVPQSSYWLFDGDIPVGVGRLRHCLNEVLQKTSGHIGYAIRKSQRGKGYGTAILSLLIKEAALLGIEQLQVATDSSNAKSQKVIIRNGGVFRREEEGKNIYSIALTP